MGHQARRATLTILCSRRISSPFEIQEVQEMGPCEMAIIAASPVESMEEASDRMQQLLEIEEQLILIRNRVIELQEQLR